MRKSVVVGGSFVHITARQIIHDPYIFCPGTCHVSRDLLEVPTSTSIAVMQAVRVSFIKYCNHLANPTISPMSQHVMDVRFSRVANWVTCGHPFAIDNFNTNVAMFLQLYHWRLVTKARHPVLLHRIASTQTLLYVKHIDRGSQIRRSL